MSKKTAKTSTKEPWVLTVERLRQIDGVRIGKFAEMFPEGMPITTENLRQCPVNSANGGGYYGLLKPEVMQKIVTATQNAQRQYSRKYNPLERIHADKLLEIENQRREAIQMETERFRAEVIAAGLSENMYDLCDQVTARILNELGPDALYKDFD